ncbi:unnamed protein product, partial [Polarella glacialis]
MAATTWKVVGGADKGGIVVRAGRALTSAQLPERLATGAVVQELQLEGERLKYSRLSGDGPQMGWVSLRLKDKELLVEVDAGGAAIPKKKPADTLKKSWDQKFLFKGCGANLRALEGGTAGASRDQLFEFLMRQHVSPELRLNFWDQIPEHLYDTSLSDEEDCIMFFQTAGHLGSEATGKRRASPGGVRQRVEMLGGLRCIVVEREGTEVPSTVVVLAHGIDVLGDDLYGLAHRLALRGLRLVLPEAPHTSSTEREEEAALQVACPIDEHESDRVEWRRPLREWWPRQAGWEKGLAGSAPLLARCAAAA